MAVYLVKTPDGNRIIEAKNPSAAVNFAVEKLGITAESLNPSELAKWVKEGVQIESALPAEKAAA